VVITGGLHNAGPDDATAATLLVRLYDENGRPMGAVQASLSTTAIPPGGTAAFRAEFPGVYAFSALRFESSSRGLRRSPEPPAGATPVS
jgi:hypothetical protein